MNLTARAAYSNPKKGLVYCQVVATTEDPYKSVMNSVSQDGLIPQQDEINVMHMTYEVSKDIRINQVLPKTYDESLLYLQGKRIIDST